MSPPASPDAKKYEWVLHSPRLSLATSCCPRHGQLRHGCCIDCAKVAWASMPYYMAVARPAPR